MAMLLSFAGNAVSWTIGLFFSAVHLEQTDEYMRVYIYVGRRSDGSETETLADREHSF